VRTLAALPAGTFTAPVIAAAGGRAVAAWVEGGDVRYSVYR
jgi:hypothetical protein